MDLMHAGKAVILGIVEGLTEFIPVSSTGHLLIAERLLGFADPGGVFTVVIQLGAILAVCLLYRATLIRAVVDLPKTNEAGQEAKTFAWSVVIATLPAVLIGLPLDKLVEKHIFTPEIAPLVVAATFALGGLAIILIERRQHRVQYSFATSLPWRIALFIGCCQVLAALLPGTSRSGATIMGALLLGVARPAAAEFSFFLAIPAMFGGSLLKLIKHHNELTTDRLGEIAIGFVVAFLVAWLVIKWLIRFVTTHTFAGFGWYRLIAGLLIAAALVANILPAAIKA